MDRSGLAPLVLRLGRQSLRPQVKTRSFRLALYAPFSSSTCRGAAPLPPSSDNASAAKSKELEIPEHEPSAASTPPPPPPPKRSLRPFIWATGFILIGVTTSAVMRAIVFPPPLPEPDSDEDAALVSRIRSDLNALPIVAELRKDREAWREYDPYSQREAFMIGSLQGEAEVDQHLTAGSYRGARGLAVQRSFYNAAEKREISIVFLGGALSGWPGVTHGGVLMTVLKEAIERAANGPGFASRLEDSESPKTIGETSAERRSRLECESLTLNYKRPTRANYFYVIRAEVQDAAPEKPGHTHVKASLEDGLTAKVGVYADGYCVRGGTAGKVQTAVSNGAGGLWSGVASLFGSTA